jgi:plasmid replication initiation protein
MKNNNDVQLSLPLFIDDEIVYKDAIKQNWKFTFSRQKMSSVHTKRVIALVIAQMKEEGEMREFYQIRAADIIRQVGLAKEEVYRLMKGVIYELVNVAFVFESEKGDTIIPRHLIDTTRFKNPVSYQNGTLILAFNPTLRDVIMELTHYAKFELDAYMKFSSWYSMRIWELLSAYKDTGWWEVPIEEYREYMGCGVEYTDKGVERKDKQGNFKYLKYPNTSDMIKFTTAEPLQELKGTELEFTVEPIYQSVGRGRPSIVKVRFDLVFAQYTNSQKIELYSQTNSKFQNAVERLRKWKVSDENIVKYAHAIGSERINQLLFTWQSKNLTNAPIGNPLTYCNLAFEKEGKRSLKEKLKV